MPQPVNISWFGLGGMCWRPKRARARFERQCATTTRATSPLSGAIAVRRARLAFPGVGRGQQPTQRLLDAEAARLDHRRALARHAVAAGAVGVAVRDTLDYERVLGRIHHCGPQARVRRCGVLKWDKGVAGGCGRCLTVAAAQVRRELERANLALRRRDVRELVR
eukprot:scaffold7177_cov75-Phaeocystis_antarctica.AAC.4